MTLAVTEASFILPELDLHITRKTFDSKIRNFGALLIPNGNSR